MLTLKLSVWHLIVPPWAWVVFWRHCLHNMKRKPTGSHKLVALRYVWIVGWTQIRRRKGWSCVVGLLSCRESNASTANSGVSFSCPSYVYMCRDNGSGIDAFIRNAPCAFNYIIYPIFVQCYVMGRFRHENGPFWMLQCSLGSFGLVFFYSIGAVLVGAVLVSMGRFWRWAVLVGSRSLCY